MTARPSLNFRSWIEAQQWDGTPRLATWLAQVLGQEPNPYLARVGHYIVLAHTARAMAPGCRLDFAPLLHGPAGTGKSSLPCVLVGARHFSDGGLFHRNADSRDCPLGLAAYEIPEASHLRKSELVALKAFIATRMDRYRSPYKHRTEEIPRSFVTWLTANDLPPEPSRRVWPIYVDQKVNLELLQTLRGQLFAEAAAQFASGEPWHPSHEEELALFAQPAQRATEGGAQ